MSSLLTTSIGHQLSNHFFLKESNSTQPDLRSSYDVSDGDQLTVSPLCTMSDQHGTNHVSERPKLEFEELFTSNLSETHLPGVFAASPVSTSQNDPTAAASLPIVVAETLSSCQVTSISGDASEVLRVHSIGSNRESPKLLKRCKHRLTRLSRPWFRRAQKIKRPRAQFRSTDRDPPVPVDTKHSSGHCPSGSILQDLQNQYSSLTVELHGIKTQLTDLQQACTSIHSLLLRLQPNPIPLTTVVCGTANPAALGTFPSVIYPAPVPTAVVQNPTKNMDSDVLYPQSAYPSSLSVCPPKLTQITVHTNLFDGSTKTMSSISTAVQRESARSEPLQSGIRGVPTPSVSSYVSSPMFSDCGSSVSSASTPQLSLDDGIPDSSSKLTTKQIQRAHQSTAGFISTGSTENPTTTSSSSAHSSASSSSCSISHTSTSITTTTTSMTLANDLNSISGTTDAVDTMELVQRLRTLLTTHGLSQRQLAKILPGCSQRFIRDLLAKPRPWSGLTDKRRLVYRHLRLWLDDPANVAKLSSDQTDPSPLVTHDSAHSEQKAHGTTTNTSCSAFSLGPSDSTLEISVPSKERRRSTSSNADSVSLFSGSCSSGTRTGESRKPSGENDQQTEKRIADILSAARIAMAQEECSKTQRSDVVRCASNQDTKSSEDLDLNPNDPINPSLQSEIVGGESSAPVAEVHRSTTINPEASLPLTSSINVQSVTTITSSVAQASETIVANSSTNLPLVLPPLGVPTPASTDEFPGLLQFILSQSCTGLNPVQSAASTSVPAVPPVDNSPNQPSSDVGNPVHAKPTVTASDGSSLSVSAVAPAPRSSELGLTREIVSQLSGNALNPLSQTLLLLAQTVTPQSQSVPTNTSSVEVIGSNVENNLPNSSPASSALPKSCTDTQLPGVDAPLFTALQPPPLGNILSSMTFAGMPPQKPDSPPTYSSQNQSANANGSIETDPTGRTAPTNLYQRPSTDEVVQVAKKLDDLDTDLLRARVKDVLRQNGVSQRLFGEVILGMCQASVSDMLSKPRAWSQLTEKARLPYVRMHMWLNQPDGLDALRGAAVSANNVPKHGLRSQTQSVGSNYDVELPVSTQTIMSTKSEYEFRKRERSAHTPNHSPVGTPVKLTKVEPASSTAPTDPLDCLDQSLSDSDRQSLVDIAKAATLAMKRACGVGSNNLKVRGQGDQPSSVPGTPTKRDVLVNQPPKIVPRPANGFDLNRASHPIDSSFLGRNRVVFSPAQKQALLAEFTRQPYPSSSSLRALARDLNLPYKPVVNWFHNRRMRSRQRVPFSVSTQDETTSKIIRDLASDSILPEWSDRECNEDLLVQAHFTPTDEQPPVGDCATVASSGSQANRRKRPDPTRLIAESGTAITPSE